MAKIEVSENIKHIFKRGRKCVINTDLDGLLSGMLLQHFLDWKIVGFSSCCGKPDDELWFEDDIEKLSDFVFVDLPVSLKDVSVIDQHFVSFDDRSIEAYNFQKNKVNPNVIRKRVFKNSKGSCEYTSKYPFGTFHFILAALENLGIIDSTFTFNFTKKIENFDLIDLVCRADRVIGNTCQYTPNCIDWSDWLMEIGGVNTRALFFVVQNEYRSRSYVEHLVEYKLQSLGCKGKDGECSNLFRELNYISLDKYFSFLSDSLELKPIKLKKVYSFNKLRGKRVEINKDQLELIKKETEKNKVFSFAFVTMRTLSMTYIEE